jgi:hypothetical protein
VHCSRFVGSSAKPGKHAHSVNITVPALRRMQNVVEGSQPWVPSMQLINDGATVGANEGRPSPSVGAGVGAEGADGVPVGAEEGGASAVVGTSVGLPVGTDVGLVVAKQAVLSTGEAKKPSRHVHE